jgi:hypothetical protein
MRLKRLWWSGRVASMLGGLVSVRVAAAAPKQFLPILGVREGGQRFVHIPHAGIIRPCSVTAAHGRRSHDELCSSGGHRGLTGPVSSALGTGSFLPVLPS